MDAIITLTGNIGKQPERRVLANGSAVVKTRIAVSQGRDSTMWLGLVVWHPDQASAATKLEGCEVGRRIDVVGRLTSREWTDNNGQKRTDYEVTAYSIRPWPPKDGAGERRGPQTAATYSADDEIPF